MSQKCPYCGSYNTELRVGTYVGRGIANIVRYSLAGGAYVIGSLFHHAAGHKLGEHVLKETKLKPFKSYHCNNCGEDFNKPNEIKYYKF